MQPLPYAPYPLDLVRDWFYRRRNWVRVVVIVVLGVWLGPPVCRLWNLPSPPRYMAYNPAGLEDAGLNIPAPEVDCSKAMMAAITSLPTPPSAGPTATPPPSGMKWISWSDYERTHGIARPEDIPAGSAPGPTFRFDASEALAGPWMETRFHLNQIVAYLELPTTRSALRTISDLSGQPYCLCNSAVNPAGTMGLASVRGLARLFTARAHCRLVGQHDYAGAADDLEAVWRLSAGLEDDGMLIPALVSSACRALALSEATRWCNDGRLSRVEAEDLLRRLHQHHFDGPTVVNTALDGERRVSLSYLDGMYLPGEHGRQVFIVPSAQPGQWLLRSMNLFSPLTYDRGEAQRWIQTVWDFDRAQAAAPAGEPYHAELRTQVTTDPLFLLAACYPSASGWRFTFAARIEAEAEAARTSLALVMFRADHGHYPNQLEELVPAYLPALHPDPFSALPLRYRVEANGRIALYSVGEDGQDDGGNGAQDVACQPPKDLVYTDQGRPWEEWVLVPIDTDSQPSSRESED